MQETCRLWTIQTPEAWERAHQRGHLIGDGRYVDPYFRPAYRWLREQMKRRLPDFDGGYPVWAWPEKPDLRHTGHLPANQPGIRLAFEAPATSVLLSDFDLWHIVLGGGYCAQSEADDNTFYERQAAATDVRTLARCQREIRASWERIFDIDAIDNQWWGKKRHLQATLGRVALDQITRVDYFVAR